MAQVQSGQPGSERRTLQTINSRAGLQGRSRAWRRRSPASRTRSPPCSRIASPSSRAGAPISAKPPAGAAKRRRARGSSTPFERRRTRRCARNARDTGEHRARPRVLQTPGELVVMKSSTARRRAGAVGRSAASVTCCRCWCWCCTCLRSISRRVAARSADRRRRRDRRGIGRPAGAA